MMKVRKKSQISCQIWSYNVNNNSTEEKLTILEFLYSISIEFLQIILSNAKKVIEKSDIY